MRTVVNSCLLLGFIFTTSCGNVLEMYVNHDLAYNKPRKILYSQALGISAMNSIVEDGGSYFDKVTFNSFASYDIKAEPIQVNSEEVDPKAIAEVCKSFQADGLLLTRYVRTYTRDQSTDYYRYNLSASSAMSMMYYNSNGELIVSFKFFPPYKEDVKDALRKGVRFGVKKLVKTCWIY